MTSTANSETKDAEYAVHIIEPPIKEIKTSPLKEMLLVTFDSNDVPPKLAINDVQNMPRIEIKSCKYFNLPISKS